ncbi:MAG: phage Gp37/Gp68 family protein [Propionivibrio sp.]|nr:phage Gp37/Gp68 family protein [Propionivibrio sp.]
MSIGSRVEWTRTYLEDGTYIQGATWSPVTGCTKKSSGCKNCYAEHEVETRWSKNPRSVFFGRAFTDIRCHPEQLGQILRWKKGRRIFVCPRADLFHDDVPFEFIAAVFGAMAIASQHTFLITTKRPERMLSFFEWLDHEASRVPTSSGAASLCILQLLKTGVDLPRSAGSAKSADIAWPLRNVQLGVSVEDQPAADERIPLLLKTPAVIRWLSLEPLLGSVDLELLDCMGGPYRAIDWVVVGGESGENARPMHPEWAREIQEQCHYAKVPFFFKQWGTWLPISEMPDAGESLYEPAPARDPHAARHCRVATRAIAYDGGDHWRQTGLVPSFLTFKVGKRAAGHLLDGKVYREFPGVPS